MTSLDFVYLISIDSLFNSLLFILIYNINLSKKDKISYYQTFILSAKVRYLYFVSLFAINFVLNLLFYRNIDISLLACPLFTYICYNKTYINRYVNILFTEINLRFQKLICYILYIVLLFLSKTILIEECTIKLTEIEEFYSKSGYNKLFDFLQSFVIACVYEYISVSYVSLSFLFQYKSGFNENYKKKQYILGLLNDKQWDKLLHSSTISIFFDIYKNSNNKQISKFIQYQLNRIHYRLLIFFTAWSIIGYLNKPYITPIIFFFFYIDDWRKHRLLYNIIGLMSIFNICDFIIPIALYSIPYNWIYTILKNMQKISYDKNSIFLSILTFLNIISINKVEYLFGYLVINFLLFRRIFYKNLFFAIFGYISSYNISHMIYLLCMVAIFDVFKINIKKRIKQYV
jgi:hypothetical protein